MKAALRVGVLLVLLMASLAWAASSARRAAADNPPPPGFLAGTGNLQGTELVDDGAFTGAICIRRPSPSSGCGGREPTTGRPPTALTWCTPPRSRLTQTLYGDGPLQVQVEKPSPTTTARTGRMAPPTRLVRRVTADPGGVPDLRGRPRVPPRRQRRPGAVHRPPAPSRGGQPTTAQPNPFLRPVDADADCTVVGNAAGDAGHRRRPGLHRPSPTRASTTPVSAATA